MLPTIPEATPAWLYFLCLAGAVLVIGIGKAGFGGGIGMLAVPLLAIALPAQRTIGVILPILIVADLFAVRHHRGNASHPHVRWLLGGAVVGIVAGTGVLWWFDHTGVLEVALNATIGSICLVFVGVQCYRLAGGHVARISPRPIAGKVAGSIAGLVSTLTHAAGPVINIYLLEQRLSKRLLVGTAVIWAFVGNLLKLPTYFGLQLISPSTLLESLWALPLVPVGTFLGYWMYRRINERAFIIVMYLGAAAAAAYMLHQAATTSAS